MFLKLISFEFATLRFFPDLLLSPSCRFGKRCKVVNSKLSSLRNIHPRTDILKQVDVCKVGAGVFTQLQYCITQLSPLIQSIFNRFSKKPFLIRACEKFINGFEKDHESASYLP